MSVIENELKTEIEVNISVRVGNKTSGPQQLFPALTEFPYTLSTQGPRINNLIQAWGDHCRLHLSSSVSPGKTLQVHAGASLSLLWTCGLVPWIDVLDHCVAASCWEPVPALAQGSPRAPGICGWAHWCLWCLLPHPGPVRLHPAGVYSQAQGHCCAWPHGSQQSWHCPASHFCFLAQTQLALAHCSSRPCPQSENPGPEFWVSPQSQS